MDSATKSHRSRNPNYRFRERIISLVHLVALSLFLLFGVVIGSGLLILLPFGRQRRLPAHANWSMGA